MLKWERFIGIAYDEFNCNGCLLKNSFTSIYFINLAGINQSSFK